MIPIWALVFFFPPRTDYYLRYEHTDQIFPDINRLALLLVQAFLYQVIWTSLYSKILIAPPDIRTIPFPGRHFHNLPLSAIGLQRFNKTRKS